MKVTDGNRHLVLASHDGMSIRFAEEEVRAMGRSAAGVRGIDLREGDHVVGVALVRPDQDLLAVTEKGYGKRTPLTEYQGAARAAASASRPCILPRKTARSSIARAVNESDEVLFISTGGQMIRSKVNDIRETGRSAQGVRIMRIKEDVRIACVAVVVNQEEPAEEQEATPAT